MIVAYSCRGSRTGTVTCVCTPARVATATVMTAPGATGSDGTSTVAVALADTADVSTRPSTRRCRR